MRAFALAMILLVAVLTGETGLAAAGGETTGSGSCRCSADHWFSGGCSISGPCPCTCSCPFIGGCSCVCSGAVIANPVGD